jgi:hypothetical protein
MKILDAIYMQLPAIPRRPKSHNGYYLSRSFGSAAPPIPGAPDPPLPPVANVRMFLCGPNL